MPKNFARTCTIVLSLGTLLSTAIAIFSKEGQHLIKVSWLYLMSAIENANVAHLSYLTNFALILIILILIATRKIQDKRSPSPTHAQHNNNTGKKKPPPISLTKKWTQYFRSRLKEYAKTGGQIYLTSLFENYSHGDPVIDAIKDAAPYEKSVEIYRYVLLDDETEEPKWISAFLKLKEINNLTPIIYRIKPEERPLLRKMATRCPRVNFATFSQINSPVELVHIGLQGGADPRGIQITRKDICRTILTYIKTFNPYFDYLKNHETFLASTNATDIFFKKIRFNLTELAEKRDGQICFIGIFGAYGLSLQKQIPKYSYLDNNHDLDLLIVVKRTVSLKEIQKQLVEMIIKISEQSSDIEATDISYEWSNDGTDYYVKRKKIHINIKLHHSNSDYYNTDQLLGLSILDSSLYPQYTLHQSHISNYLELPSPALDTDSRINLVLETKRSGIKTALKCLTCPQAHPATDFNRILWIALQNYIWAVTGTRLRLVTHINNFLNEQQFQAKLPSEISEQFLEAFDDGKKITLETPEQIEVVLLEIKSELTRIKSVCNTYQSSSQKAESLTA